MRDPIDHAAYATARVRGMRSELFSREKLDDLLDQEDVGILVEVLLNSPYERHLAEALTRYHGADAVEAAVTADLVESFQRLAQLSQGPRREWVHTFLLRWDLAAVKALLRNGHHGIAVTEPGLGFQPGPTLSLALAREFSAQPSMAALVNRLVFWNPELCRPLLRGLRTFERTGHVGVLEEALDRSYFVRHARLLAPGRADEAHDEDRAQLRTVLQMEIDRINVRTLMQLRPPHAEPEATMARLLGEGSISGVLLRKMAEAPDVGHVMELLGPTRYHEVVEGLYQFLQTQRFSPIQRMLDMILLAELRRMARARVLSLAVLMRYAWLKYNEVTNLRLIARGLTRHLPRGRVREGVLYA